MKRNENEEIAELVGFFFNNFFFLPNVPSCDNSDKGDS